VANAIDPIFSSSQNLYFFWFEDRNIRQQMIKPWVGQSEKHHSQVAEDGPTAYEFYRIARASVTHLADVDSPPGAAFL